MTRTNLTNHLRKNGIITDADKRKQADWMVKTKSISGKPACWECYFTLIKQGYIEA